MADQLQLRGGTTAQNATFTGAQREVTVDTTKHTLVVHDGVTQGGYPLALSSDFNWARSPLSSAIDNVKEMLDAQPVSIWEFANLAIGYSPGGDPSAWDWSPALQAAFDLNLPVIATNGVFTLKSTVTYTKTNRLSGYGIGNTIIKYLGPADTWALSHLFTGDGSNQFPGRMYFSDFTLQGDGTGVLGAGATVNGILCADNSANLVNIPWYHLARVQFDRLKTGIELEGYGHMFLDCWAEKCLTGFDLTHPEQTSMIGTWANQCDIGVDINNRKLKSGHVMHIIGGAYQRCRIGIRAKNFFELRVDTYFELNTERDFLSGDPADGGNYTKGIKDLTLRCHSASGPSIANIDLYASNGSDIDYSGYGSSNATVPHVQANGFCKETVVTYNPEAITSSTPFVFNGSAITTAIARVRGGSEQVKTPTMGTLYTSVAANPIGYFLLDMKVVRIRGAFSVTTGYTGNIFTLPVGYRPKYLSNFIVATFAGSWGNGAIQISTGGAVTWNTPGDNRTVYIDISLERDDGFF